MLDKDIKKEVKHLLKNFEKLRDDDHRLIANVWSRYLGKDKVAKMTADDFLKAYADKKLPNAETIRRHRQLLQEDFPDLRGKLYDERQKHSESVKKEIKRV